MGVQGLILSTERSVRETTTANRFPKVYELSGVFARYLNGSLQWGLFMVSKHLACRCNYLYRRLFSIRLLVIVVSVICCAIKCFCEGGRPNRGWRDVVLLEVLYLLLESSGFYLDICMCPLASRAAVQTCYSIADSNGGFFPNPLNKWQESGRTQASCLFQSGGGYGSCNPQEIDISLARVTLPAPPASRLVVKVIWCNALLYWLILWVP